MADNEKNLFNELKLAAQKGLAAIDVEALKEKASEATDVLKEKAVEIKDAAVAAKDEITDKLTELDRMLQDVVTEYNDAYTIMNDKGVQLFVERSRANDSISFVEAFVNRIQIPGFVHGISPFPMISGIMVHQISNAVNQIQ